MIDNFWSRPGKDWVIYGLDEMCRPSDALDVFDRICQKYGYRFGIKTFLEYFYDCERDGQIVRYKDVEADPDTGLSWGDLYIVLYEGYDPDNLPDEDDLLRDLSWDDLPEED
ncbi:MAG: hypothetical protein J7540_07845 [Roseofilum sp. SID2]|uniref:hypothetical protein n=1 Tax=unclassified Roseofilum TaxID=2620099 RepID=UPI001B05C82D|nr:MULTISPECIES: hypothetical protein [unclassified Roseofilum]MBP0011778.1 hypothetical protein [Roseofilum sp. SID3]MBP0023892.1 hypothetical protein [Roseofilum sp. SID2]